MNDVYLRNEKNELLYVVRTPDGRFVKKAHGMGYAYYVDEICDTYQDAAKIKRSFASGLCNHMCTIEKGYHMHIGYKLDVLKESVLAKFDLTNRILSFNEYSRFVADIIADLLTAK